jgi:transcriptional regulator with XRE-family HTH domain
MNRVDLTLQFAERLRNALINAGYGSARSASGVNIQKLAAITGCSVQICRKYLQGKVVPEPSKLSMLAEKLNVSPGWLLFGDSHSNAQQVENKITISKDLLHYIFMHANKLYSNAQTNEVPDFLLGLTNNVSKINVDDEQSKKIVDLALYSANHFHSNASDDYS